MAELKGDGKIVAPGEGVPEIAARFPTDATITDVIEENDGNLPSARYPRSSRENQENRFYVQDAATAGDFRAEIVRGEKFPPLRPAERQEDVEQGGVYDRGDTGGSPRGMDTRGGK